ncbi:MAG: GC-type dockerin domain-anchored protein [Phycisphaerales bacterium JB064]
MHKPMRWRALAFTAVLALFGATQGVAAQECEPGWLEGVFCQPGTDDRVNTTTSGVVGDGEPLLYIGGRFDSAGCTSVRALAAWDGATWSDVGGGVPGEVNAMVIFDDGSGPALYVSGRFSSVGGVPALNIAKWDGTQWHALSGGIDGQVNELAVFDDGSGPAIYAAGGFDTIDGQRVNNIARWNGAQWDSLGLGVYSTTGSAGVGAMAVFDDGSGPALYVGGQFTMAGDIFARSIAKWNGATWSALGSGTSGDVGAMEVFDDGAGPALYVGGDFQVMSGVLVENIARWDGSGWSPFGSGTEFGIYGRVYALQAFVEDGTPTLAVGGNFIRAGGEPAARIARWTTMGWSTMGSGLDKTPGAAIVEDMALYDDGSGPALFVVGTSDRAGGSAVRNVARWSDGAWSAERNLLTSLDDDVAAFAVFDEGEGPRLFAGGDFEIAGEEPSRGVARWDGRVWTSVKEENVEGVEGIVRALASFDDGSGPALYVGGRFSRAGERDALNVARWTGAQWQPLGQGLDGVVSSFAVFDDGSGPALYAGGHFHMSGDEILNHIARWDGTAWQPLAVDGVAGMNDYVNDLKAFDDGRGPALFITGSFNTAGEIDANRIVRWDGSAWSVLEGPMGQGLDRSGSGGLDGLTLEIHDDGRGDALYVGGAFDLAGGRVVNRVARWDGADWEPLSGPLEIGVGEVEVNALLSFDDGSGLKLYAGGLFQTAGGITAGNIARWDGTRWEAMPTPAGSGLGTHTGSDVWALAAFDAGEGPLLIAGGRFTRSSGSPSDYTAAWKGCQGLCPADFDGDGTLTLFDFLEFSNAFHVGDPRADFDGDGRYTVFDFLLFSNEFDAGCP